MWYSQHQTGGESINQWVLSRAVQLSSSMSAHCSFNEGEGPFDI